MYKDFVESGISLGKRPESTGGGIVRSSGGWTGLKESRKAGIRIKGDERILGDSDFVENVLKTSEEAFDQRYEIKARGIDFNKVKERVAEIMDITPEDVTAYDKSPQTVQARSLLCFWAHRKRGMSTVQIARLLNMSQPAISRSSRRGEKIARENQFELIINRNA